MRAIALCPLAGEAAMGFGLNIADDAGKPLRCRVTIVPGFGVGPCEHEFRPGLPLPVAQSGENIWRGQPKTDRRNLVCQSSANILERLGKSAQGARRKRGTPFGGGGAERPGPA